MSSMVRISTAILLLGTAIGASAPTVANEAAEWDQARASLVATQPGPMAESIARWQQLKDSNTFAFADYAGFMLVNPGFPDEAGLRATAESKLLDEAIAGPRLIAFFDRFPPLTNPARAQYALALAGAGRDEDARSVAVEAWRNGEMSETAEASLGSIYGYDFTQADHDARMDALLWEGETTAAERQLPRVSEDRRFVYEARLVALNGSDPRAFNSAAEMGAMTDAGFVFNR